MWECQVRLEELEVTSSINCNYLLKNVFFTKGLLHAKLDHLYAICAAENSPVFQSYTVSPCFGFSLQCRVQGNLTVRVLEFL